MNFHQFLIRSVRVCVGAFAASACAFAMASANDASGHRVHPPAGTPKSDGFYYTTYELNNQTLSWVTCGQNSQSEGCYGSGQIGPFGRACAIAGSAKRVVVEDSNPASGTTTLYVYKQIESETPSAHLIGTYPLASIPASGSAHCHLAIGGDFAYVGTDQSATFYQVNLKTGSMGSLSVCGTLTSSITANDRFVVVSQSGCFIGYDLNGNSWEDGGEFSNTFVPGQNAYTP